VMECAYASHGDTRHVCLYPANPEECFYMAVQAFDLAERLQTPVLVLSDLDIGMNDWMCRDLKWDDNYRPDRGKVLGRDEILKLEKFYRFIDKDGDGITPRTLPGVHPKAAYFARGSGHTQYGAYTEDAADYQLVLDRLLKKWATAKKLVPRAVIDATAGAPVGLVSLGSCDGAVREAIEVLKSRGVGVDYMRVRSFPFSEDVERFLAAHELLFVVEQNRDAQFRALLTLETDVEKSRLRSLLHYNGLPISSSFIVEGVLAELRPRERRPRLQFRARPHALDRHGRERRQPQPALHRGFRRRRYPLHRSRAVLPRDPPQPQHAVHHREQRRLWAHQGAVFRIRRRRQPGQEGRDQLPAADRPGAAGDDARRLLRGAQLLG